MKKFLSILLALTLLLALGATAFAEDVQYEDMKTVTITKSYELTNPGMDSPAETFNFTIERTSVTDAASGVTAENMPIPTIGSVTYAKGEAGSANKSKDITVTLPDYNSVGIYTYTIKETAGTAAGVSYYGDDITLVVTVIEQDGKVRVAAVHTEGANEAKSDDFANTYSAGTLTVTKKVTGNMGDKTKKFPVSIQLFVREGYTIGTEVEGSEGTRFTSNVMYNGEPLVFRSATSNGVKTYNAGIRVDLADGESAVITNIPYFVQYDVVEADDFTVAPDNYDAPVYTGTDEQTWEKIEKSAGYKDNNGNVVMVPGIRSTLDSAEETVTITNNKGVTVDTGITMDSLPYVVLLSLALVGLAVFFFRKRVTE